MDGSESNQQLEVHVTLGLSQEIWRQFRYWSNEQRRTPEGQIEFMIQQWLLDHSRPELRLPRPDRWVEKPAP